MEVTTTELNQRISQLQMTSEIREELVIRQTEVISMLEKLKVNNQEIIDKQDEVIKLQSDYISELTRGGLIL